MTSSANIGVPSEPADALEMFYRQHGLRTVEEKIHALERQLQQFPHHAMPRDRRLRELEIMARNKINGDDRQALDRKKQRDKFKDLYKQVNDNPVAGSESIGPLQNAILGGQIQIEKEGFDGN
jgi:hypothetical protein